MKTQKFLKCSGLLSPVSGRWKSYYLFFVAREDQNLNSQKLWSNPSLYSLYRSILTLYLICKFLALPIQQQIKICQKYGQMGIQLPNWVESIVGKGEIARHEQFLLFPHCFQKLSIFWCIKMSIYEVKGLI